MADRTYELVTTSTKNLGRLAIIESRGAERREVWHRLWLLGRSDIEQDVRDAAAQRMRFLLRRSAPAESDHMVSKESRT